MKWSQPFTDRTSKSRLSVRERPVLAQSGRSHANSILSPIRNGVSCRLIRKYVKPSVGQVPRPHGRSRNGRFRRAHRRSYLAVPSMFMRQTMLMQESAALVQAWALALLPADPRIADVIWRMALAGVG